MVIKKSVYECCDSIYTHYELIPNAPVDKDAFISLKDSLYNTQIMVIPNFEIADVMNRFFKTTAYSILDEQKDVLFDSILEKTLVALMAELVYRQAQDARATDSHTNVRLVTEEGVTWRLTADRLMLNGRVLEAKSRKANTWAFVLTGVVILAALFGAFRRKKQAPQ
jgi:hypothetical protein